jgi:hypothetical protein
VYGQSSSASGFGVYGFGPGVAIHGFAQNNFGVGMEGVGQGSSSHGVAGSILTDSDTSSGVYGTSAGSTSFAGNFDGKVAVAGSLSKGGGSFRIDHPLDPANRILQHSFVESPDMKNVYDGVVTADAKGEATVELPDWFEALNRDFRYSLTAIGASMPDLFIRSKVVKGAFTIGGAKPRGDVSWQVTGIRRDAWANANRIEVELDKRREDRGRYLHPTEHGQPASKGVDWPMRQRIAGRTQDAA